jgi:hypothetical protein
VVAGWARMVLAEQENAPTDAERVARLLRAAPVPAVPLD